MENKTQDSNEDSTLGMICAFGFFGAEPPNGWLPCQGQLLPISQYDALYNFIGTTYGGDGNTTFGLPNFQGRVPIGPGQGPGLSSYYPGQAGGQENVILNPNNLPSHTHGTSVAKLPVGNPATSNDPKGNYYALSNAAASKVYFNVGDAAMGGTTVTSGSTGGSAPFNVMNQYLTFNYCICVVGDLPARHVEGEE